MGRRITDISKKTVTMTREDWCIFVEETDKAIGLTLHDFDGGKSKQIKYPLEVHLFLLSVIEAAVDFGGATLTRGGGNCCEDDCAPFGGCDYEYGNIAVCNEGDLIVCEGAA